MKKKVNLTILKDMERYGMSTDGCEPSIGSTDVSVITALRNFYDRNLPIDLDAWFRANEPNDFFACKRQLGEQYSFIRNILCGILYDSPEEYNDAPPTVISTHIANSMKLPVYHIYLSKWNLSILIKGNFYDWKVSVTSELPLVFADCGLFDRDYEILPIQCDGFPRKNIYGSYKQNNKKFTVHLSSDYDLYTFMYWIKSQLSQKGD